MNDVRQIVEQALEKNNGILKLKPAWVARTFLSGGKRLGLKENEYKLYFAGLVINNQNLKPERIFTAKSKINLADILLRKKTEGFEARLMFGLKKEDLKEFLKSFSQKEFCPPGLAAWEIYLKIER